MSQAALAHDHGALAQRSFDRTIHQALFQLDRIAVRRGVHLSIESDPTEFAAVTLANEKTQARLLPIFDFRLHRFDRDNFIWLKGLDEDGAIVVTAAIRLLEMRGMNLKQFCEALLLFYGDPKTQSSPGEIYNLNCPCGPSVKGQVTFSGAIWIEPRFRGAGPDGFRLSQVLGRFMRLLGQMCWDPDFYLTAISEILREKGMTEAYGWPRAEAGIDWTRPRSVTKGPAHLTGSLLWMTRFELITDTLPVAQGRLGRVNATKAIPPTPAVAAE